jgi:hypothetical protein
MVDVVVDREEQHRGVLAPYIHATSTTTSGSECRAKIHNALLPLNIKECNSRFLEVKQFEL